MIALILNDTTITGYDLRVSCELALPEDDLSGQGSSSATAERGVKAKRLKISLKIPYDDSEVLSNLLQLSIATDESTSQRTIYNIDNQTASAFGVRQVRFTDKVSAQEMEGTQAWVVSFMLVEYLSISEKLEEQNSDSETTVASADSSVASESSSTTTSWLDKIIAQLNTTLSNES